MFEKVFYKLYISYSIIKRVYKYHNYNLTNTNKCICIFKNTLNLVTFFRNCNSHKFMYIYIYIEIRHKF